MHRTRSWGPAPPGAHTACATARAPARCTRPNPGRRYSPGALGGSRRAARVRSPRSRLAVALDALLDGAEDAGARRVAHVEAHGVPEVEERGLCRARLHLLDQARFHQAR